jgi:predicted ester cyclase
MKKLFVAIAAFCICISCNDNSTSGGSDAAKKNIAASDAISNAFSTGDVSKVDSFVSDDFLDHTDQGDKKGKDSLKAMINMVHTNMKDMKVEKIKELADDEFVMTWQRYTGTSNGAMGMPAGPYDMSAIEVAKFKDGKAIEHWSFMDMATMMKMMGSMQPHDMGNPNKMDDKMSDNSKADSNKMKK